MSTLGYSPASISKLLPLHREASKSFAKYEAAKASLVASYEAGTTTPLGPAVPPVRMAKEAALRAAKVLEDSCLEGTSSVSKKAFEQAFLDVFIPIKLFRKAVEDLQPAVRPPPPPLPQPAAPTKK
jgi:hypothetical protein